MGNHPTAAIGTNPRSKIKIRGSRELWDACSHVSQVERDFNLREGLRPEEDTLPARFLEQPIPDGPSKGATVDIQRMVQDYYREKGWV